jgi:DEAD/DEAH box helicase domain-containing protein
MANYIFEAFLMLNPFERQDIAIACDRHRTARGPIAEGTRFIALFDQVYGSLRLSGRLLEDGVLANVLTRAIELAAADAAAVIHALRSMRLALDAPAQVIGSEHDGIGQKSAPSSGTLIRVILPGGKGLNVKNGNEEFQVDSIFFNPVLNEACYRGHTLSTEIQRRGQQPTTTILPVSAVVPVPGESTEGLYDCMTGDSRPEAAE